MSSVSLMSSSSQTDVIRRRRSLVQGDPSASSLFNLILDGPAYEFEQECRNRGWGFQLDGFVLPILFFADHWFLAKGADELTKMTAMD